MLENNWQKAKDIFGVALLQCAEERQNFISQACGNDRALLREVKSLLSFFNRDSNFMETPAVGEVAEIIFEENGKLSKGQILGHYKIMRCLGAGGMGAVYLAQDLKLRRRVALKILQNKAFSNEKLNQFLLREAQISAMFEHPNICTIYEIFEAQEYSFIVMQYINGKTLAEILQKERLSIEKSIALAIQIAEALNEAHTHHIAHRDIKPANIMVDQKGQAKVLDFGLATSVETRIADASSKLLISDSLIMGTVPYMSPEQARGESLDTRTDIFSFGVLFYEMLTGFSPFARENNVKTIFAILKEEPSFSMFPPLLEQILQKSLAKDKDRRYQSIKKLLKDLHGLPPNQTLNEVQPSDTGDFQDAETEIIQRIEYKKVKKRPPQLNSFFKPSFFICNGNSLWQ